jgi:hypothetical protein
LEDAVTGSVHHQSGRHYYDYPCSEGFMRFGGTGIKVRDFVAQFLEIVGTPQAFMK